MKSPAFQFYPQDFISSLDIQVMSVEQVGAYWLLLTNAWIHEPQGYLPNNDLLLQRICRMNDKQWSKNKSLILKKFEKDGEFIFNARLLKELGKQEEYRKKQALNGSKGGRPKANDNPEKAVGFSGETQTKAKKTSSISSSISTSNILLEKESKGALSDFEKFEMTVKKYPGTKRGAKTEWADFSKKYKSELSTDLIRAIWNGIQTKINTNKELEKAGQFVPEWPHLKTYLNQRRWEEETEVKAPPEPVKEPKAFNSLEEHHDYWGGGVNPDFKPKAA